MEKNPEHYDRLSPVLEYLENIMKVKADRMKRIWYFETDGSSDHYPKYISGSMASDEHSRLCNADSKSFEKIVCSDYKFFCVRGNPYSVDDSRIGSHTCWII